MSTLAVTAIILGTLGVLECFVPRLWGVLFAFAGLLSAWFSGAPYVDGSVIVFWFVAAVLVVGIDVFSSREKALTRMGNSYIVVGTIVGTLLGYVTAPTAASIITGSVVGAVLGSLAFRSTPRGPKALSFFSPVFINFLCSNGLRAVVTCSICGITVASVL